MQRLPAKSMRSRARLTGAVYFLYFAFAIAGVLAAKGLIVPDDAAATAQAILAQEARFRLGCTLALVADAFYVALVALLYDLLAPVDRRFSLLAALFGLVGCAVQVIGTVFAAGALMLLDDGTRFVGAFDVAQLQALALLLLRLQTRAFDAGLVFFAVYCVSIGGLVFRSGFLPRVLGALLVAAGIGWLAWLWPPLANAVAPYVQTFGFVAELIFMLWLLVRGVDERRTGREDASHE